MKKIINWCFEDMTVPKGWFAFIVIGTIIDLILKIIKELV
jgi:hypothetical protein